MSLSFDLIAIANLLGAIKQEDVKEVEETQISVTYVRTADLSSAFGNSVRSLRQIELLGSDEHEPETEWRARISHQKSSRRCSKRAGEEFGLTFQTSFHDGSADVKPDNSCSTDLSKVIRSQCKICPGLFPIDERRPAIVRTCNDPTSFISPARAQDLPSVPSVWTSNTAIVELARFVSGSCK